MMEFELHCSIWPTFDSVVFPESITVNMGQARFELRRSYSRLIACVYTESDEIDFETLRNDTLDNIQTMINCGSYINKSFFFVKLDATYIRSSGIFASLQKFSPPIDFTPNIYVLDVIHATFVEKYLKRTLNELNQAIINTVDTAFHCRRAVEAIMQSFKRETNNEKAAWDILQTSLNVDENYLTWLAKISNRPRHAHWDHITWETRKMAMERAWAVTERFVIYLLQDRQPLPFDKYPLLSAPADFDAFDRVMAKVKDAPPMAGDDVKE